MALSEVAENYFSTLNPIAERISEDIEAIREAYEDLWRCLTQRERDQIINETVIYPEAILKYALNSTLEPYDIASLDILYDPTTTGSKYIVDEGTGLSWRDEHSGPFSWKTPSQIDLTIFGSSKTHSQNEGNSIFHKNEINKDHVEAITTKRVWGLNENNCFNDKKEVICLERNGNKKIIETPDSPNVVLGGTCSKISGLCSKLKFLPSRSYSYEVKTVAFPHNSTATNDANLLEKIKASAVSTIHNTIKFVGGKNHSVTDKKLTNGTEESENLVHSKDSITVIRLQKPSPRVNKPKSPPPPPPSLKQAQKLDDFPTKLNTVFTKSDRTIIEADAENAALLQENSENSLPSVEQDSYTCENATKMSGVHELSDDIHSVSTECTPLSGPSFDNIPKSGFDFLDNW